MKKVNNKPTPRHKKHLIQSKKLKIYVVIILIAAVGIVALRFTKAAPVDGWQRQRIVNTAAAEVGQKEWSPRVMQYTQNYKEPWCADFVSWVYLKAGYPFNSGAGPGRSSWRITLAWKQVAGYPNLRDYMIKRNAYRTRQSGYVPGPGDIIIFGDTASHTGIVEQVSKLPNKSRPWVYTIEGNVSDTVGRRAYSLDDSSIHGYGIVINNPNAPPVK